MTMQLGFVTGPALGGLIFAVPRYGPELVYGSGAALFLVAGVLAVAIHEPRVIALEPGTRVGGWESLLAGLRFVRRTEVLLGAIALDLFAVLFAGAVWLLPVFARSLDVGATGLGVMRSAPAIGAIVAGIWLTWRPLRRREGRTLLITVGCFGASMVVFGLSRSMALSCVALAFSGLTDMISMNVRAMTVAMATPDELRGRVNAVEMVFISASNELGGLESGVAAALLGAVPAVVIGGGITIALALAWTRLFPALARVDGLVNLRPEAVP
jgi:predicted MFS family arabinose efflux permease